MVVQIFLVSFKMCSSHLDNHLLIVPNFLHYNEMPLALKLHFLLQFFSHYPKVICRILLLALVLKICSQQLYSTQ